ncbi:hypothetical protein G7Y89_g15840 [Cudoniella acicularis]|uniref:Ubiquitin-like domain-containing protein n=1 Tax=Cudoniella acicularis TaxID=354080 RepID=A0A8H4QF94_9HELO|nr:hypothetical protein G7Y89_g15840 [Cudoniella acicularis]
MSSHSSSGRFARTLLPMESDQDAGDSSAIADATYAIYSNLLSRSSIEYLHSSHFVNFVNKAVVGTHIVTLYAITIAQAIEDPTPLMDTLWHEAILDTCFYTELQKELGCILHRRPEGASDGEAEARKLRLASMEALYAVYFNSRPHETLANISSTGGTVYPSLPRALGSGNRATPNDGSRADSAERKHVIVETHRGDRFVIPVTLDMTVDQVKGFIQEIEGVPVDARRLIFGGGELGDGLTLSSCGVQFESTLILVLRLRGC